jgi:hypothetical protein
MATLYPLSTGTHDQTCCCSRHRNRDTPGFSAHVLCATAMIILEAGHGALHEQISRNII